jgi:hypothetical protein
VLQALQEMKLRYPKFDKQHMKELAAIREQLAGPDKKSA